MGNTEMNCCCAPKLGTFYPIEESLIKAMSTLKVRKYSLEEITKKLNEIFEEKNKQDMENNDKLRNIFLDNNIETNSYYVIHNEIFDKFIKSLKKLTIFDILVLIFPLLDNSQERDMLKFEKILSEHYGEYTLRDLEETLKRVIIFYTREINIIMKDKLTDKDDIKCIKKMNLELFSEEQIEGSYFRNLRILFVSKSMDSVVREKECNNIVRYAKIWDYQQIRNNLFREL